MTFSYVDIRVRPNACCASKTAPLAWGVNVTTQLVLIYSHFGLTTSPANYMNQGTEIASRLPFISKPLAIELSRHSTFGWPLNPIFPAVFVCLFNTFDSASHCLPSTRIYSTRWCNFRSRGFTVIEHTCVAQLQHQQGLGFLQCPWKKNGHKYFVKSHWLLSYRVAELTSSSSSSSFWVYFLFPCLFYCSAVLWGLAIFCCTCVFRMLVFHTVSF